MKNLWPNQFKETSERSPKELLETQAGFLGQITGGIVVAEVRKMDSGAVLFAAQKAEFGFSLFLIGKFIDDYSFRVFQVFHDIAFYPVLTRLDEGIARELGYYNLGIGTSVARSESADEFEELLASVFRSERIKKVVGSIMALSK